MRETCCMTIGGQTFLCGDRGAVGKQQGARVPPDRALHLCPRRIISARYVLVERVWIGRSV